MRLTGSPDSGWLPDRLPGRLSDSQIAGKHPFGIDRLSLSRNPLGRLLAGAVCHSMVTLISVIALFDAKIIKTRVDQAIGKRPTTLYDYLMISVC